MNYKTNIINTILISIISIFIFISCNNNSKKITEGIIEYDITYPYFKDHFMKSILPSTMVFEFKDGIYKNTIEKAIFATSLISNCKDSVLIMTMNFGKKRYYSELDAALTDTMLQRNGIPDVVYVNSTDSMVGLLCKKHIGVFDNLKDGYDCEVYETDEIGLEGSNWCNPYRDLDGVILGYEVDQFGLQMRFRATKITDTIVSDSVFNIPPNYKKIPLERMLFEIEEIFKSL